MTASAKQIQLGRIQPLGISNGPASAACLNVIRAGSVAGLTAHAQLRGRDRIGGGQFYGSCGVALEAP